MRINDYKFGKMVIGGKQYEADLLICGQKIKHDWWRRQGHFLCSEDLGWVLKKEPEVLIIGTGKNGIMKVPDEVQKELESSLDKIISAPTEKAVGLFNEYQNSDQKIAGAFHLTC